MRDEIAKSAYSIYLRRGARGGEDERNWLDAEAQVRARHASTVYVRTINRVRPVLDAVTSMASCRRGDAVDLEPDGSCFPG